MTQEQTGIFESIFRSLYFQYPNEAAAYYVVLVKNEFPSTLIKLSRQANVGYTLLVRGRSELLKNGFIAKVINANDDNIPSKKGELYLPVSPMLIWQDHMHRQATMDSEDAISYRNKKIEALEENYKINFKKFGFGIERGSIFVYYSSNWFFNTIVNNLEEKHRLSLMLGGLGSFEPRFIPFYEKMLVQVPEEKRIHMKILFDLPIKPRAPIAPKKNESLNNQDEKIYNDEMEKYEREIEKYQKNMQKYTLDVERLNKSINYIKPLLDACPQNMEFKTKKVPHATSRRLIFLHSDGVPYIAIDARKDLGNEDENSPSFYLATIYIQDEAANQLNIAFEESWQNSEEYPPLKCA